MTLSKRDAFLIWIVLLAGLVGLIIHTYIIFDAFSHTGDVFPKYVTQIDYNAYGEGDLELVLLPSFTLLSMYGTYRYFVDVMLGS